MTGIELAYLAGVFIGCLLGRFWPRLRMNVWGEAICLALFGAAVGAMGFVLARFAP